MPGHHVNLPDAPVILFDGVCHLCSATVRFVIRRDPRARCRFLPIQSDRGRELYRAHGLDPEKPDTLLVLANGKALKRSDAAIAIGRELGFPWSIATVGLILPRSLRDALYDFVASRRYRWFGRNESCLMPTPDIRSRFLE
jgi:predicted DCC family thiol-disulfide oxidoreductase YuxK